MNFDHTHHLCTWICNLQLTEPHLPSVCGRDQLTGLRGVPLLLSDHQHTPRRVECGHYLLSAYWHLIALKWETPLCTADQPDRLSLMEYAHLLIHVPVNTQCQCKTTLEYTATWQVKCKLYLLAFWKDRRQEAINIRKQWPWEKQQMHHKHKKIQQLKSYTKMTNKKLCWYLCTNHFYSKKSETDNCWVWNLTFRSKQCQFQVQNILFNMPAWAGCRKKNINELWQNTSLVQGHDHLPLPPNHCSCHPSHNTPMLGTPPCGNIML